MATSKTDEFDFVKKPSRDNFCPITWELLREPHQTLCCGNHLSQEVVATLQKDDKPCPLCKEASLETVPDKFFKRRVLELKIRCPHRGQGCKWTNELGKLAGHLSTGSLEGECKFEKVACAYSCGREVQRCEMGAHKTSECPLRPTKCQYCGRDAAHSELTSGRHLLQCEQYPLECPNGCGKHAIKRRKLSCHLDQCPMELIDCEFSHVGCTARLQRVKMANHTRQGVEAHLSRTCTVVRQQADALQEQTAMLQAQAAALQEQTAVIATLQQQVKELGAHLKPEALDQRPFIPPPPFTMTDFEEHRDADDTWYSPPFYSSIGGYKMCLIVNANGAQVGQSTHLSVFVCLMRGEHDDDIPWPYEGVITFQLVNQRGDWGHRKLSYSFVADRVRESDPVPIGLGFAQFFPHPALYFNRPTNTEYLKNNSLKFQVIEIKLS